MDVVIDDFEGWDEFVLSHPQSTAYHSSKWRDVVREAYGLSTYYLSARRDGRVVGVLPLARVGAPLLGRQLVSLPYHMYGGVIADEPGVCSGLLDRAVEVARSAGAGRIELRNVVPVDADWKARSNKVSMVLSLPDDAEELWKSFSAKVRNQCRKGEKADLEFLSDPPGALEDFYRIMVINMRDLGSPVHARTFFAAAQRHFPAASRIHVVRHEGKAIAAGFTIAFKRKVEIPWASSLREYNSLCPNMFLYWSILKDSIGRGVREFDFGRSTLNSGTYRFKKQWGGKEIPLHYQYWTARDTGEVPSGTQGRVYQAAARVWCRLPLVLTRLLGPHLVRRIP